LLDACTMMTDAELDALQDRLGDVGRKGNRNKTWDDCRDANAAITQLRQLCDYWMERAKDADIAGDALCAGAEAAKGLLRSIHYRLNGSQDVCAKPICDDIDAALAQEKK
jgi:hypothetical protein